MAYLGLARKWRPQTFEDLVGQAHIARTISNAIKAGRVSQGYLFTGTRGIGKTTSARIFAKALRCPTPVAPGVPCNKCNDCTEISEGRSVDVLEIDGASNNGVDAVREIRENAKYLPSNGKYKIYIIDEVHMLTTAAFNALLKTLEEPPAHVIFVFATTDPQKIPATVLSRCQRFDFKRVSQKDIMGRLKQICDAEKVNITPEALTILSREAEGSMRDAVSLLDQVLSVGEGKITADEIASALGLVDKQTVLDCVTGIIKRNPLLALEAVGKVYLHGFDLKQFGREVLRNLRQIIVARLLEQNNSLANLSAYMDISDVDIADLKALTQERSLDDLDMLFRLLNHGLEEVARSTIPKMVMDVLVVKMASAEELVCLGEIESPEDVGTPPTSGGGGSRQTSQASAAKPASAKPAAVRAAESQAPEQPRPVAAAAAPVAEQASAARQLPTDHTQLWKSAVAFVKSQKPLVGNILEHLGLETITQDSTTTVIKLGYTKDQSFYKDQLLSKAYSDLAHQLLKNYLGRAVRLEYKEAVSSKSLEDLEQEKHRALLQQRRQNVLDSEAIKATQQLLGAKLERLEIH